MIQFLCSTGTMNRSGMKTDAQKLTEVYPLIDCDGYELLMQTSWTEEYLERCLILTAAGIPLPVVHLSKRIGSNLSSGNPGSIEEALRITEENCAMAHRLGIKKAVIHLWGYPDSNFDCVIKGYAGAVKICGEYGIEAMAETLPCWEQPLIVRIKQLVDTNPTCRITIDSRHLRWNNMIESIFNVDWLWKEDRIAHVHISDCMVDKNGQAMQKPILHPGEGVIDIERFVNSLTDKGYNGYITLESPAELSEDGKINTEKINKSMKLLRDIASKAL